MLASCSSGSTDGRGSTALSVQTESGDIITPSAAIDAAKNIIKSEFANDATFVDDECIAYNTDVPGRFRVEGRFSTLSKDYSALVFGMYIQKFDTGWEYGNFMIQNSWDGEYILRKHGRMKELEQNENIGDIITAGGIDFTIAEKKPTAIRLYTNKKLSHSQLKGAIVELKDHYEIIQFATKAKHERGEEYASWTGEMFFDYDSGEIIGKSKFIQ